MKFATFFYPGYYNCIRRNQAANVCINEWALLQRNAPSVFVETVPIVPLLGYTDCSNPSVLAQEAGIANAYGIDAFIFNYYFDGQNSELGRPLDIFSRLKTRMEFSINLCCHMPKRKLPFGVNDENIAPYSFWTKKQFEQFASEISNRYLTKPNYLKIEDHAIITFYHVNAFTYLYGPQGLRNLIDILRNKTSSLGIKIHVIGLFSIAGGWNRLPRATQHLPFDSFSCYVGLPDFGSDQPIQPLPALAEKWVRLMSEQSGNFMQQKLIGCVGAGWNATSRGEQNYDPRRDGLKFPYYPIVIDDSPNEFKKYLSNSVQEALWNSSYDSNLFFLGPWNEWSEGCYLLPDKKFGFGKLEAVKQVKKMLKPI